MASSKGIPFRIDRWIARNLRSRSGSRPALLLIRWYGTPQTKARSKESRLRDGFFHAHVKRSCRLMDKYLREIGASCRCRESANKSLSRSINGATRR